MKGHEAKPSAEWEAADHSPTFLAGPREADGSFLISDLVMQIASGIAFDLPPEADFASLEFECDVDGTDVAATARAETFAHAIHAKHLWSSNSRKPKDVRHVARELVLDILADKEDWGPYSGIFKTCAERNDRDFFERLARGLLRGRKPVFDRIEWFSLTNWHGWLNFPYNDETCRDLWPPLKCWTVEAALRLIEYLAEMGGVAFKVKNETGLATKWKRLGLIRETPALVVGFFPVRSQPGQFKLRFRR